MGHNREPRNKSMNIWKFDTWCRGHCRSLKKDYLINDAGIIDYLENMRLDMEKCEIRYLYHTSDQS